MAERPCADQSGAVTEYAVLGLPQTAWPDPATPARFARYAQDDGGGDDGHNA